MSAPARRRVIDEEPEDRSKRNLVVLLGALVGISVGVLAAFFIAPPLIDHYFGTADIDLGEPYERDGSVFRLPPPVATPSFGGGVEILLEVRGPVPDFAPGDIVLESAGGRRVGAIAVDTEGGWGMPPVTLLILSFPADGGGEPSILHVKRLEVRFHLRPRETE